MAVSARIAVGICAYNEENNIGNLLENLVMKQDLPENSRILVICSGCTDRTPEIVKTYEAKDNRIKLITEKERRGKAHALNKLFATAKDLSDILVLTNADTVPAKKSIRKLVTKLVESEAGAVFAQPVPSTDTHGFSNGIMRAIWRLHHTVSLHQTPKLTGELCAVYTRCLRSIPENVATDEPYIELVIRKQGYSILYAPEAKVYIRTPTNAVDILKQRKRIWIGHMQIERSTGFKVSTSNFSSILKALGFLKPLEIVYTFFGGFLEFIAYFEARLAFRKRAIPYVWEPIKSTKTQL